MSQETATAEQAFNPEVRQGDKEWQAYKDSRPTQDAQGNVHGPDGKFVNADEHFARQYAEADAKHNDQTAYEDMSVPQLARKLAQAEFHGDKTSEENVDDVLQYKLDDMDEKFYSERDDSSTFSSRLPDNPDNGVNHNDLRSEKLYDRVMKIRDRELDRLEAEQKGSAAPTSEASEEAKEKSEKTEEPEAADEPSEQQEGAESAETEEPSKADKEPKLTDYIPDWIKGDRDKAEEWANWQERSESQESEPETTRLTDKYAWEEAAEREQVYEPEDSRGRIRQKMAAAARKLRELPITALVAGQVAADATREYYDNEDERGQRRRKITAAVVGAVGLAGLTYLAHKGAEVSSIGGDVHHHAPGAMHHVHHVAGGAHEHIQAAREHSEQALRHGQTIWGNEQHSIAESHPGISHQELEERTAKAVNQTLRANGLSYEDATHLPDNFHYHLPPHVQAELFGKTGKS